MTVVACSPRSSSTRSWSRCSAGGRRSSSPCPSSRRTGPRSAVLPVGRLLRARRRVLPLGIPDPLRNPRRHRGPGRRGRLRLLDRRPPPPRSMPGSPPAAWSAPCCASGRHPRATCCAATGPARAVSAPTTGGRAPPGSTSPWHARTRTPVAPTPTAVPFSPGVTVTCTGDGGGRELVTYDGFTEWRELRLRRGGLVHTVSLSDRPTDLTAARHVLSTLRPATNAELSPPLRPAHPALTCQAAGSARGGSGATGGACRRTPSGSPPARRSPRAAGRGRAAG